MCEGALATPPSYPPPLGPCEAIHHWRDGCSLVSPERFVQVFRFMFPVYGALHVIPAVLFKWQKFARTPAKVLIRALLGTARSSAFLGVFVVIYQSASFPFCIGDECVRGLTGSADSCTMREDELAPVLPRTTCGRGASAAEGRGRRVHQQAVVLGARVPRRPCAVPRRATPARGAGDVRAPEGARECLDNGPRTRVCIRAR